MKKNRKFARLLCGLLCLCLCLCACRNNTDPSTTGKVEKPKDVVYTITVKTAGGMAFDGLVAYVYEDATEDDLLTFGTLDANGSFTFTAAESDQYTVRFPNLPEEGYAVQAYYPVTGAQTDIVLTSSVIAGKDALEAGKTYKVGDVMRDFTVTTVDGQELTLSKILEEKQAVVLNFWYTGCDPCKSEFPLLQAAYEAYGDQVEVITMNPIDITGDNAEKIIAFRDSMGLTMPMAMCSSQWLSALGFAAYPTTVIIDRYGMVCVLEVGAVTDDGAFEAAFQHFAAEDYQQKLIGSLSELNTVEYPVGDEKNPFLANGGMEEFEVTVAGGAEFHVQLFRANGITLHIEEPGAYLVMDGKTYSPDSKGVIEVLIENPDVTTSTNLIIGNTGVTEVTIKVQLLLPKGTFSNPHKGGLGQQTVTVEPNNDQGVYYSWTAPADGMLTVTVTGTSNEKYDVQLYNLNSYAVRNLSEEELVDANGNRYVSVKVSAGDVVSIGYMSAPDESFQYAGVTIQADVSFLEGGEEGPKYSITFKDTEGNPIPNVSISLSVNGVNMEYVSNENGQILMDLPSGMYTVKVTIPEGYVCETTQFLLSDSNTSKEVIMAVYVPQEQAYTVYVVDADGKPIANATVALGDRYVNTDANGMASFLLIESKDYVVTVVAPEGYSQAQDQYAFGSKTTLKVVLTKNTPAQEEAEYTVKVVDANGKAYTNVRVQLVSADGKISITEAVNNSGKLKVRLPKGTYTVALVFPADNAMGYDATNTTLTPSNNTITLQVAPLFQGQTEELYTGYVAWYVNAGSLYVDLSNTDIQFFLFCPEEKGIYTFTTVSADCAVGYWGSPFYIADFSAELVKDNVCTMEVRSVGQTYVLSVAGAGGTIIKIEKTGEIVETIYETYEGTTVPTTPFTANVTGNKTFLDLSVAHNLVKGEDGFYHLETADGPIVMVDLIAGNYEISISNLVANSAMVRYEFDANGKPLKRVDYTPCMVSYVENVDAKLGVYALTDDLITILQNHGNHAGWYDSTSHSYLFGTDTVLEGNGWMFLLCVFQ